MVGVSAFEFGNVAATLLILRASELLGPDRSQDRATQLALGCAEHAPGGECAELVQARGRIP